MKKIFGMVLALALVLSMAVIPSPVAAGTLQCLSVTQTNPITGQPSDYTITFTTQEPVEPDWAMGSPFGEYIDITFPPTTTLAITGGVSNVIVTGMDSAGPIVYDYPFPAGGGSIGGVIPRVLGNTLRIYLDITTTPSATGDLVAGTITVQIIDIVTNGDPCNQTLCVGTKAETCTDCPEYTIYLSKCTLLPGWNLMSIPGVPADPDITVVLADLIAKQVTDPTFIFKVYYYDCTTWYVFNNGIYASLEEMKECAAYWIWVNKTTQFKIHGSFYPPPPGPPLKKCYHECWNMVGFTSYLDREPFNDSGGVACSGVNPYIMGLSPSTTSIDSILGWDAANQIWAPVVQFPPAAVAPSVNCLVVCQGYWMSFSEDGCFTPPPPGT